MKKLARRALAAGIGLLVALLGLELGLRFLLFSDSALARRLGASWRKAEWYADPRSEDAYWKLRYLFADPKRRFDHTNSSDPECGWTGDIDPETYLPIRPVDLRGRRPVLLYGDSYADCNTPLGQCFEDLLEKSALGDRYCLVNYGVGGYGIDQEYLLLRRSIDLWKDRDPIVVISFLVDDDFPRNLLSFRDWPKPRVRIEEGRLVSEPVPILDSKLYIAAHPIGIRSYFWRFLLFRKGVLPARVQGRLRAYIDRRDEAIAIGQRLLEEMDAELRARELTHFFLVFHGEDALQPNSQSQWAKDLVSETVARLGVPTIETRPFLIAAADGSWELAEARFFGGTERTIGHYNELGNVVAFEALRQGIEGRFDAIDASRVVGILHRFPYDPSASPSMRILDCPAAPVESDRTSLVRWAGTPYPPFPPEARTPYLLLRPGSSGRVGVRVALPERSSRLRGRAITVAKDADRLPPTLTLAIRLDGREMLRSAVPLWPQGLELDLDVSGSRELEIDVEASGSMPGNAWIHVAGARLE